MSSPSHTSPSLSKKNSNNSTSYPSHMNNIYRKDIKTALAEGLREINVEIQEEMKDAYLDYSMSVIIGRAIPDVRDGLKPVHRRILYAMHERAWRHDKPFVKSAKIVGEVIGNYHPHGDGAIYDSLVRLSQDFAMRETLIDGQGNFGSIDGDRAAAYRYTEARLSKLASEMLQDIDKDTVDFVPNYDASKKEPKVLPSSYPNLLVNGSSGIAVGMATSIPPHNLSEVIEATKALIENPDLSIQDLMQFVKGPDFPTGGIIIGKDSLKAAYETGRASFLVRAKVEIIPSKNKKNEIIVIHEIPYQVNKSKLLEKIGNLVQKREVEGIADIKDLSDRNGIYVEIELKRGVNSQVILNQLYKLTQLQENFSVNLLALWKGKPEVFNLKSMLTAYISHHKEVLIRRTRYQLNAAERQAHILTGLKIALDFIDETIKIIRSSKNATEAGIKLMKRFELTEIQVKAILEMRLQKLTSLETEKIIQELEELEKKIKEYKSILENEKKQYKIISNELSDINKRFPTQRATALDNSNKESVEIDEIELIADETIVVMLSEDNFIRRLNNATFRKQKRGGKGVKGQSTTSSSIKSMLFASTHDLLFLFSNKGKVFSLKAYELIETTKDSRGKSLKGLINLAQGEIISMMTAIKSTDVDKYIVIVTQKGYLKKMEISAFKNVRKGGMLAIGLRDKDVLQSISLVSSEDDIFMATRLGYSLRTKVKALRSQGRTATGVIGMRLSQEDRVIGLDIIKDNTKLLTVTENAYGKLVDYKLFTAKNKGGKGMFCVKRTEKMGNVINIATISSKSDVLLMTKNGMTIRVGTDEISSLGRMASGVKLAKLNTEDTVRNILVIPAEI